MNQAERQLRIREIFARQEFVNFEDLCKEISASKSSVRRDLMVLEQKNVLRRVHGGAMSLQTRDESMDFSHLSVSFQNEKARIGLRAAEMIEDGQTVILSGGSTVVEVARRLNGKSVHIVTNSIPVAQIFWDSKQVEVTLTGGYLFPRLGVQLGPICEKMLSGVSADVLVLGIRGITAAGISDSNSLIVESIRAMIRAAQRVIVVADHSKFGRSALVPITPLSDVDEVVSDSGLSLEFQQMLREQGVSCVIA